jgi:hypothetical protein
VVGSGEDRNGDAAIRDAPDTLPHSITYLTFMVPRFLCGIHLSAISKSHFRCMQPIVSRVEQLARPA